MNIFLRTIILHQKQEIQKKVRGHCSHRVGHCLLILWSQAAFFLVNTFLAGLNLSLGPYGAHKRRILRRSSLFCDSHM